MQDGIVVPLFPAEVRRALATRLKLTKSGYEATVRGDSPLEAFTLALGAHAALVGYRARGATPPEPDKAERRPLVVGANAQEVTVQAGGGAATPFNPALQAIAEDYRVKVELTLNSKGVGWEITAKAETVDAALALIAETEHLLQGATWSQ